MAEEIDEALWAAAVDYQMASDAYNRTEVRTDKPGSRFADVSHGEKEGKAVDVAQETFERALMQHIDPDIADDVDVEETLSDWVRSAHEKQRQFEVLKGKYLEAVKQVLDAVELAAVDFIAAWNERSATERSQKRSPGAYDILHDPKKSEIAEEKKNRFEILLLQSIDPTISSDADVDDVLGAWELDHLERSKEFGQRKKHFLDQAKISLGEDKSEGWTR